MSVTYTATLPVRDQTVLYLSRLLVAERLRRGTRAGSRALSPFQQAVLILRWFLDATRVAQLAVDNANKKSTVYDYLHEGFTVLAAQAPQLDSALLAAKMAGHSHISIDGTLIETDRRRTPGPHQELICGGRASMPTMAGTFRLLLPRTAGRCGPPRCDRVASTTPPLYASTPRSCPPWPPGSPRTLPHSAISGQPRSEGRLQQRQRWLLLRQPDQSLRATPPSILRSTCGVKCSTACEPPQRLRGRSVIEPS